jgi:hypothetical protein
VQFVTADKEAFYKATQPIRDKYGAKYAALLKRIKETAVAVRREGVAPREDAAPLFLSGAHGSIPFVKRPAPEPVLSRRLARMSDGGRHRYRRRWSGFTWRASCCRARRSS